MLAVYLKQLRVRAKQSTQQWSLSSGISRTTLWRWEQDKALPRDEELKLALNALHATSEEQARAREMLRQERAMKGVGSLPPLTGTGLRPNELLKTLRLHHSWPQREAAERLGVNRVTLANWERGEHWPDASVLHQICLMYGASPDEIAALTTLSPTPQAHLPSRPEDVRWHDPETYTGDFTNLELHYLTCRAQLAQMSHSAARAREVACTLDYVEALVVQVRSDELLRHLRHVADHPALLASPLFSARYQRMYASMLPGHNRGVRTAERILKELLAAGDAVPLEERSRAKAAWAERRAKQDDPETALRLSKSAFADAQASDSPPLVAVGRRQWTATLVNTSRFTAAEAALHHFPTHTPLFAVQQLYTYAALLEQADSRVEARAAYEQAARAAYAAGMTGYGNRFIELANSIRS